jgi:DNA invertase Pin-like site-specific DNA recombinase
MVNRALAYGREDRDLAILYSHTMNMDIPDFLYFIDKPKESSELDELLSVVRAGDTVVVGTITDFTASGELWEVMRALEDLDEAGVRVVSRLEPDYNIVVYRAALRVAAEMLNIRDGRGPVRTR